MSVPLPLREDYDGSALRELAKRSCDANQTRRLLALAVIYDGGRRDEAARVGGSGRPQGAGPDGEVGRPSASGLGRSSRARADPGG